MKAHEYEFHFRDIGQLRADIEHMHLDIPVTDNFTALADPLLIGDTQAPNRLCVLPMEGCDAVENGSPGGLTFRRYIRYAEGGFGLIWFEATAVTPEARSQPAQLQLNKDNVGIYVQLVKAMRKAATDRFHRDIVIIIQLAHAGPYCRPEGIPAPIIAYHDPDLDRRLGISGEYPVVTDDYLDKLQDAYIRAAALAAEAGFDGVDIKSCHNDLIAQLATAHTRNGKYGGSLENRTGFLTATIGRIAAEVPGIFPATRMSVYDAVHWPYGFGTDKKDYEKPDLNEPIALMRMLEDAGLGLANISTGMPILGTDIGAAPVSETDKRAKREHPLKQFSKIIGITSEIRRAVPNLPIIVGGGYSWLRQFMPYVAAAVIEKGWASAIGLGRAAMAYPNAPADIFEKGEMEPAKCCITCSACIQLMRDGGRVGCVIKDKEIYGSEYRHRRHFSPDNLKAEALRCLHCEAADCSAACPTHIDVPTFIKAFADGDIDKAYETIRRSNVLPEMCSHLCPAWLQCEGACIQATLTGRAIPIRDIQYAVCRLARERGLTGIRLKTKYSGKNIAVIGGGPAGLACVIRLIEKGHNVVLFERESKLGGTPELLIPERRLPSVSAEIDMILQPAVKAGLLKVKFNSILGEDIMLADLRKRYDAVLLAAGLWSELSIGKAEGVSDAISFLQNAKNGKLISVPQRVAILSGGDCAMDAAVTAKELGVVDLYIIYGGSLADMHWHMADDWFRTNGVHCLTLTDPLGYEVNKQGRLIGLRTCRTVLGPPDGENRRLPAPLPGSESVLPVDMVIEAMGLGISSQLRNAIAGVTFTTTGLVKTVRENSFETELNKVFAAGALINGGSTVAQCIAEGMQAADEIDKLL
ncbi:MAG: FAD-dependent oxidoreductase [Lentisphaerae bacterium]|nr:FAD-dependent oxidoreductase [Lentisphaerota bacterium]